MRPEERASQSIIEKLTEDLRGATADADAAESRKRLALMLERHAKEQIDFKGDLSRFPRIS